MIKIEELSSSNKNNKEKEKTRDSEQLLIYTGGEYLAPVCKAFNGESSFLKDRFALCHLSHDWFLRCSRCSCFSCSIPNLMEEFDCSQLIDNLMRDLMIYRLKDIKIYKSKFFKNLIEKIRLSNFLGLIKELSSLSP